MTVMTHASFTAWVMAELLVTGNWFDSFLYSKNIHTDMHSWIHMVYDIIDIISSRIVSYHINLYHVYASGWKTARVVLLLFQYGGWVGWGGVGY